MPNGIFTLTQVNQAVRQGAWTGFIAPTWVEYLVVAGGGGGGYLAGGGGAGGLLTGVVTVLAGTSYTVTVGSGGAGGTGGNQGASGANAVFGAISATGGGAGGSYPNADGASGGSGGGADNPITLGGLHGTFGQGIAGQGNAGGLSWAGSNFTGGGGGGAGTVGLNPVAANGSAAGNGGSGMASSISGTVTTYAGGGGGAADTNGTGGLGGVGGGGAGGVSRGATGGSGTINGVSGGGNTGGGGGGYGVSGAGGSGGSGVVIIRYPGTVQYFTGGTLSYANGYVIHTFNASGTLAPTTPTPYVANDYQISRSLRFNSADSANLTRTPASATNRTTWTWSGWVKRGTLSSAGALFSAGTATGNQTRLFFGGANTLAIDSYVSGSFVFQLYSTAVYRDTSAWYHIVCAFDSTQATSSDRIKIYVNGVQVTAFGTASYPSQNLTSFVNNNNIHYVGNNPDNFYFDGYQTEVNFIDGQALTPSSFGYYDFNTGVWAPTRFVGVYGTNGFYLNFSDNSNTTAATLGRDYSGNSNNWTPNNFSVSAGAGNDSLVDVPTNWGTDTGVGGSVRGNYCTLNPLTFLNATFANGNLDTVVSVPETSNAVATFGVSSGKWYWEVTPTSTNAGMIGVCDITASASSRSWQSANGWSYFSANGNKYNNNSAASYGASYTNNDVIGVALDMDAGTLVFYKNGTSQGTAYSTGLSGKTITAYLGNGNGIGGAAQNYTTNFGQRPFAYTAPSGFRALNTQNLPTPTIGATTATQANKYFGVVLRNGGAGTYSTTVNMANGAFLWDKTRNQTGDHYLVDSVRGISQNLSSNTTGAEISIPNFYTNFGTNSYTTGVNDWGTGTTLVDWIWAANGAGVTNTAGSITSTVSANTTSGFSVVTFTATANSGTIGHGLGVAPKFIILKSRNNTSNWVCYHASLGADKYINLDSTAAAVTNLATWQNTTPTSTVFSSNGPFVTGWAEVAYCFAEVPGYSRFGTYTGNNSTDGPFVFCGFRPAYLMIKRTDGTANWLVWDAARNPSNTADLLLLPSSNSAEGTFGSYSVDLVSNGFKVRGNGAGFNGSETLIFAAFASAPQKFALAR